MAAVSSRKHRAALDVL